MMIGLRKVFFFFESYKGVGILFLVFYALKKGVT